MSELKKIENEREYRRRLVAYDEWVLSNKLDHAIFRLNVEADMEDSAKEAGA